jgi:hypothetical protein
MSLVETQTSQEQLPQLEPVTDLAVILGPQQTVEQVHDQAVTIARELSASESRWPLAQLIQICFLVILFCITSKQVVSAEAVAELLGNKPPTVEQKVTRIPRATVVATPTATPTPAATEVPIETPQPREGEFPHGAIMGRAFGTYIFAAQESDFSITIKPSNDVTDGKKSIPGIEALPDSKIVVADYETYTTWVASSDAFKTIFPNDETAQKQITEVLVELTKLVERVETDAHSETAVALDVSVELIIKYVDDNTDPQTATFIITISGSVEDLLQENPEFSYTVEQKEDEKPVLPLEVANLEPIEDLREQITPAFLEKVLGKELLAFLEGREVDLLQLSQNQVPVRLGSRMEIINLHSRYDTVSGIGDPVEPQVGELGFVDPRFGKTSIVDALYEAAGEVGTGNVIAVSAADQAGALLQLRLPEGVSVQATEIVTVTADEYADAVIFEGLDLVGAETAPDGFRSVLVLQSSLYTAMDSRLTSGLSSAEESVLDQLAGPHLVRVAVPEAAELIAAGGYVFSVDQTQPIAQIQLVAGPYVFTERNSPILVLTYPAEVKIPVADLVKNKLGKELGENWHISNFSVNALAADTFSTNQMELTLNGSISVVDVDAQVTYTFSGELPMIFDVKAYEPGAVSPRITAYSFVKASTAELNPATPTPELSASEKVTRLEANMAKDPASAATWEFIKYVASQPDIVVGINMLDLKSAYGVLSETGGDWKQALPNYEIGGKADFIVIDTKADDFNGFFGTISWVAEGKSGYFVIAQNEDAYEFTEETKKFLEKSPVPLIGFSGIIPATESMASFILKNGDFFSDEFSELVEKVEITPQGSYGDAAPLFATTEQLALTEPETEAGKRLLAFITSLNEARNAVPKMTVYEISVNDFTLDTLLANPYLFDSLDQADMNITIFGRNAGGSVTLGQAPFVFEGGSYHIDVDEAEIWNKGSVYEIWYAMKNLPVPLRYTQNDKTYILEQ